MRFAGTVLMVAVVTAATACSSPALSPSTSPFTVEVEKFLELARMRGAAQEQIDVLDGALVTGDVTMEQIIDLHSREVECLRDAGFTVRDTGMEEVLAGSGIMLPGFLANDPPGVDEVTASDLTDACNVKYTEFAEAIYMNTPGRLDQYYETFDTPQMRQCLIDRGYDVDVDATGHDINLLLVQEATDHMTEQGYETCDTATMR